MVTQNFVNIASGNGLVPDGTKPLTEPMLTKQIYLSWYSYQDIFP